MNWMEDSYAGAASDPVEKFLIENGIIGDPAADDLRGCPPDVQELVMAQGSLRSARKPAASLVIRIKKAREQCGSVYEGRGRKSQPPAIGARTSQRRSSVADDGMEES